jgi:hypothetical protein
MTGILRRALLAALAVLAAIELAACGLRTAGDSPANAPSAAQNKAATVAEADRLVALIALPPGATRLPRGTIGGGPALGTPASSSLVDRSTDWQVPAGINAVFAWMKAHPPDGLTPAGTASGGGPSGITSLGLEWSEPERAYATELQAEANLQPAGPHATRVRLDGVGLWLDPRPIPDTRTGPRLRITDVCPSRDTGTHGVTNPQPDSALEHTLIGRDLPDGAIICTYSGGNGTPTFGLTHSTRLEGADAVALAQAVTRLPIAHTDGDVTSCPMDDGSATAIVFTYPQAPAIDLWASDGCETTSNGHIEVKGGVDLARWTHLQPGLPH